MPRIDERQSLPAGAPSGGGRPPDPVPRRARRIWSARMPPIRPRTIPPRPERADGAARRIRPGARGAALLTLPAGGHHRLAFVIGACRRFTSWTGFLSGAVNGTRFSEVRRPGDDHGTAGDLVHRAGYAVPVSFGASLFLTELSPGWLKRPLGIAIELLAAVPSIVYGMWACWSSGRSSRPVQQPLQAASATPVLGALFSGRRWASILSAGIILAILIIPFIASVMRRVHRRPPMLGFQRAMRWDTWGGVERGAEPVWSASCSLGLGRALGRDHGGDLRHHRQHEPTELFVGVQAANSITSALANGFAEAGETCTSVADLTGAVPHL